MNDLERALHHLRRNPNPADAGLGQAVDLAERAHLAGEPRIEGESRLLAARAQHALDEHEASRVQAIAALTVFRGIADAQKVNEAERCIACAELFCRRWEDALDRYVEALEQRGRLLVEGTTILLPARSDPLEQAMEELVTVGSWADLLTPEWVRALGVLAHRLGEAGLPQAALAGRMFESLLESFDGADGVQALHVIVRQLEERGAFDQSKAAAHRLTIS